MTPEQRRTAASGPSEAALWTATRLLEERAVLLGTLAGQARTRNHSRSAQRFSSRADEALSQADAIRTLLTQEPSVSTPSGSQGSLVEDLEDVGDMGNDIEEIADSVDDNGDD